jgi:hypothetical protein
MEGGGCGWGAGWVWVASLGGAEWQGTAGSLSLLLALSLFSSLLLRRGRVVANGGELGEAGPRRTEAL